MSLFDRLFGRTTAQPITMRDMQAHEMRGAADGGVDLCEIEVHGEGFRQDALARLAGPKGVEGKQAYFGVTLRCEPTNPHDANAVRVECMGQHVGFASRRIAEKLSPAMLQHCGGVLEARGMIVGGWKDEYSEGHYGIHVWITTDDALRLGIRPDAFDASLREPWPKPPSAAPNEHRVSPNFGSDAEISGSDVTVTCEEHYQATIEASMPANWDPARRWPVLCDLIIVDANPHATRNGRCIEVRIGSSTIGYFTPKMTERHLPMVQRWSASSWHVTAMGSVSMGQKGGTNIRRVKLLIEHDH